MASINDEIALLVSLIDGCGSHAAGVDDDVAVHLAKALHHARAMNPRDRQGCGVNAQLVMSYLDGALIAADACGLDERVVRSMEGAHKLASRIAQRL